MKAEQVFATNGTPREIEILRERCERLAASVEKNPSIQLVNQYCDAVEALRCAKDRKYDNPLPGHKSREVAGGGL